MMTDPIADMLTRIRNAVRVERATVELPSSKVKRGVADVLKREGFIWDWKEVESAPVAQLQLELKYGPNGERLIRHIRRVSSPGHRVYSRSCRCCVLFWAGWEFRSSRRRVAWSVIVRHGSVNLAAKCSVNCGDLELW